MNEKLKHEVDLKKIEILEKFIELSKLYQQDSCMASTSDYDSIIQALELSKKPDSDIQNDLFGLVLVDIETIARYWIKKEASTAK